MQAVFEYSRKMLEEYIVRAVASNIRRE